MSRRFAEDTKVPVEKTRSDIERMLARFGATHIGYMTGPKEAQIVFTAKDRHILFKLPLPDRNDPVWTQHATSSGRSVSAATAENRWEQACRSNWRALWLCIKAKLEAVEIGITTFEDEFLAHIVMPGGETVADIVRPRIAQSYKENRPDIPLLAGPKK